MSIAAMADGFQKGMFQVISPGKSYALTVGAASVQGAVPSEGVTIVRLFSTVDAWVSFGSNPTAAIEGATSVFMPGGVVEYFEIRADEKIAVIRNVGSGKLYVTEGSAA
jgi:hypothetical protein